MAPNLDDPGPEDMAEIRDTLRNAGYPIDEMSDDEAVTAMRVHLQESIPRPSIPAGSRPVNGRVWLHEALTAGGMRAPEDKYQRARLDDGGEPIDLGVLGILIMRHLSGARPSGWTDEGLAQKIGQPVEDIRRGQTLLDEVAVLVGRPATPEPEWWKRT